MIPANFYRTVPWIHCSLAFFDFRLWAWSQAAKYNDRLCQKNPLIWSRNVISIDNRPLTVKIDPHPSNYTLSGFKNDFSWSSRIEKGTKMTHSGTISWRRRSGDVVEGSLATPVREPVAIIYFIAKTTHCKRNSKFSLKYIWSKRFELFASGDLHLTVSPRSVVFTIYRHSSWSHEVALPL